MSSRRIIAIDEEGFPRLGELRVTDPEFGRAVLSNLVRKPFGVFESTVDDVTYAIENFDDPWVVQSFDAAQNELLLPYDLRVPLDPATLCVDEWDRFHGRSENSIPWVFTRKAQVQFFDSLDEFDDESIKLGGRIFAPSPWLSVSTEVEKSTYWSTRYQNQETGWDLGAPHPALVDMLPRLKLPRSRVLILGCGAGHDAAFFASKGHVVTAVDFSEEALNRARAKYSGVAGIKWLNADVFDLNPEELGPHDLVFEHTCYCAIDPGRRNDLVRQWLRCLTPQGQFMGLFFVNDKQSGPPFGGSEWEVRQRLQKRFQFNFWGRWPSSPLGREGSELFVFAQVKRGS